MVREVVECEYNTIKIDEYHIYSTRSDRQTWSDAPFCGA